MGLPHEPLSPQEAWARYDEMEVRLSKPLSERMLALANLRPGMRVLDLATGRGEPAIRAAHRVGPEGRVLGVDVSAPMLAMAQARASREGVLNLELRVGDAAGAEASPSNPVDVVLIRWGLMYMARPLAVLERARRAMAPQALLVAAVWSEPERVPYWTLPRRLLRADRTIPPVDFEQPGPFHYASVELLERDLRSAGLRLRHHEEFEVPVMEASTAEDAIAWFCAFGMASLLNDFPEETRLAWERDVTREVEAFRRDGVIRIGGTTRIVVATRERTH